MERINFSTEGSTPFEQLLGHSKNILKKWSNLEDALFNSNTFSRELKEEIRRTLAFNNGCFYCMAKGKRSNSMKTSKELLAIKLADIFSKNVEVNDELFTQLKSLFSDKEISELCAFICFVTACQKYGALLNLQPNCSL